MRLLTERELVIKGFIQVLDYFLIAWHLAVLGKKPEGHPRVTREGSARVSAWPGLATRLLVFAAIFDLCKERSLMLSFEF